MLKKMMLCAAISFAALSVWAEDAKKDAPPPPPLTEDQAIAALAPDSPWDKKEVATRRLRQIGTSKAVPALAALLNDEKLAHLGRYALETLPGKEATEALRKAASEAKGGPKAGAITSLGVRKDEGSIDVIAAALKDSDADVVCAALGALGRIGTNNAAEILLDAAKLATDEFRAAAGDGLLTAAESLIAGVYKKDALTICATLQDSKWPENVRYGAYRVTILADRGDANKRLVDSLGGGDAKMRDYAAFLVATLPKASDTKVLAAALPKLPADGQAALLSGFAGRGDGLAREATLTALESEEANVRAAAARALGAYGDSHDITKIAALLGTDEAVSTAAKNALSATKVKGTDEELAKAASDAEPAPKALLLAILSDRMANQTNEIAVEALGDKDADVRIAALGALAKLGTKAEVPALLDAIKKTTDQGERNAGANALNSIAGVQKDDVLTPISGAISGAAVEFRAVLLGALVRIGSPNALQAYLSELKDPKKEGRDDAVRMFTQWPTGDAAAPMLEMAKNDEAHRAELMRGYVRLATAEKDVEAKTKMLTAAMELAQRPEEKWIVLPGWGSLPTAHSIDVLRALLDDEKVHNEAGIALINASKSFAQQGEDQKKVAIEALKAVVAKCDAKDPAKKVLKDLGVDLDAPAPAPAK